MPALIDTLPPAAKQLVTEAYLSRSSSRDISALLRDKAGVSLSHHGVARYIKRHLKPALATAHKLLRVQENSDTSVSESTQIIQATRSIIGADPLVSRIQKRQEDLERIAAKAEVSEDYKASVQAIRTDLDAIKLHAELTGRKQADGSVQVVLLADNHTEQHIHIEQCDPGQAAGVVDISPAPQE